MPRPPSTLQHISMIAQWNSAILSILMCDFLCQLTSSFKNSASQDRFLSKNVRVNLVEKRAAILKYTRDNR